MGLAVTTVCSISIINSMFCRCNIKKLYSKESLIILDEIQLYPLARQALKILLEDGRYDYIETGSLAEIKKKTEKSEILILSEEYPLEMFPLDFKEFLWAMGDEFTADIMRKHSSEFKPFADLHREIFKKFREGYTDQ